MPSVHAKYIIYQLLATYLGLAYLYDLFFVLL